MPNTPAPTPPPRPLVTAEGEASQARHLGHECPYRDEVHLIRRLAALGIEEQAIVGRRRDRSGAILGGAALAAVLTLAGWLYIDGRDQARAQERRDVRIEVLERARAESAPAATQLARVEQRLEGLEQRLGDRLAGIEQRLDRAENAPQRRERR